MGFENIIGNEKVKEILSNSISSNNILHSYIFVGLDGIGKCLFAIEFAKMILENKHELNNHPDFMLIEAEDGKSIKIEQIRYLQEKIAEKPIVSDKKVYIINDADFMTKEAQNCLLKTLEEPPEYASIILVLSNESKLLATIKSRCTKIVFEPLSNDEIIKYFSINQIDALNENILKVCNGSIGKAIKLKDDSIHYEQIDSILNNISKSNIIDIWNQSDVLYSSKDNINNLLEYMNIVLLDKLLDTNDTRYIKCVQYVEQTKKKLLSNANFDMCIDNLLLKIWEEF